MLKQFVITQDVVNALIEYLKKQPYEEVNIVLPILSHLPECLETNKKNPENPANKIK